MVPWLPSLALVSEELNQSMGDTKLMKESHWTDTKSPTCWARRYWELHTEHFRNQATDMMIDLSTGTDTSTKEKLQMDPVLTPAAANKKFRQITTSVRCYTMNLSSTGFWQWRRHSRFTMVRDAILRLRSCDDEAAGTSYSARYQTKIQLKTALPKQEKIVLYILKELID